MAPSSPLASPDLTASAKLVYSENDYTIEFTNSPGLDFVAKSGDGKATGVSCVSSFATVSGNDLDNHLRGVHDDVSEVHLITNSQFDTSAHTYAQHSLPGTVTLIDGGQFQAALQSIPDHQAKLHAVAAGGFPLVPSPPAVPNFSSTPSDGNIYAAPQSSTLETRDTSGYDQFPEYNTKELKKFYSDALTVRAMGGFFCLVALISIGMAVYGIPRYDTHSMIVGILSIPYIITAIGVFKKQRWGRMSGMICCWTIILINGIGLLIGALGFIALHRSKDTVFSDTAFTLDDLKTEVKRRKKLKIK